MSAKPILPISDRGAAKWRAYLTEGARQVEDAKDADRALVEMREVEGCGLDMLEVERLAKIVLK